MKKIVAISFLLLFLFNTTGYYFVQQYLLNKAQQSTAISIDQKTFNSNQLIELKVPLNIPYYQNTGFERYEGSITIKGVVYSYVERKISDGYLILKCLPDWKSQQAKEKTGDYFSKANGIDKNGTNKSDPSQSKIKISIDDFDEHIFLPGLEFAETVIHKFGKIKENQLPQHFISSCKQPPEIFS